MEKEVKGQRGCSSNSRVSPETDFLLQWGNRKRLRCAKVKKDQQQNNLLASKSDCLGRKKIASRVHVVSPEKISLSPQPHHRVSKISDSLMDRKSSAAVSPEKEDRYYTTRGSSSVGVEEKGNGKVLIEEHNVHNIKEDRGGGGLVWPKLFLSLSSKEKEQDFMAMKGCKPSQRPKKRAKLIQRSLLVSW